MKKIAIIPDIEHYMVTTAFPQNVYPGYIEKWFI